MTNQNPTDTALPEVTLERVIDAMRTFEIELEKIEGHG